MRRGPKPIELPLGDKGILIVYKVPCVIYL
jgi:hypothetical protein